MSGYFSITADLLCALLWAHAASGEETLAGRYKLRGGDNMTCSDYAGLHRSESASVEKFQPTVVTQTCTQSQHCQHYRNRNRETRKRREAEVCILFMVRYMVGVGK